MTKLAMQPMQWATTTHIDEIEPLNDNDATVLSEVQQVLKKHGMLDRFGVCLVHNHFELEDGEYMFEDTDERERKQVITVQKSEDPDQNAIQTMWKFGPDEVEMGTRCVRRCHYNNGHKNDHFREKV